MKRLGGETLLNVNEVGRARWRQGLACLCLALSVLAVSCGGDAQTGSKDYDADDAAASASVKKGVKPEPDAEAAVVETSYGQIVIELYPNLAPKMVERFKSLAKEGFYNGTAFHRVNPSAGVVQGGDPNSKDDDPRNDGMGGSPYPDLPAEFSDTPFDRTIVGAARSQSVDSANSQFYITLRRVPAWDGQYTVFGRVIKEWATWTSSPEPRRFPARKTPPRKSSSRALRSSPALISGRAKSRQSSIVNRKNLDFLFTIDDSRLLNRVVFGLRARVEFVAVAVAAVNLVDEFEFFVVLEVDADGVSIFFNVGLVGRRVVAASRLLTAVVHVFHEASMSPPESIVDDGGVVA